MIDFSPRPAVALTDRKPRRAYATGFSRTRHARMQKALGQTGQGRPFDFIITCGTPVSRVDLPLP